MRSTGSPQAARSRAGLRVAWLAALVAALCASGCQRFPFLARATPAVLRPAPTVAYRVKPGDTVARIAAWHGVEAADVRRGNGLGHGEEPAPGTSLRIAARPLATYALRPGDTLGRVGQWYGVDVDALVRLNDVADVRRLPVGQQIRIPATATRDGARAAARAHARPSVAKRAAPAAVGSAPPPAVSAPPPVAASLAPASQADVDRALAEATAAYDAADFEGALAAARGAEQSLGSANLAPADRARLARAHLLAGMSAVALGRDEDARCSFQAAVALDESAAPDSSRASPRILTVFQEAQSR